MTICHTLKEPERSPPLGDDEITNTTARSERGK